jgi:hypothetical protein
MPNLCKETEELCAKDQEAAKQKTLYENLPTGKPHISFSEMRDWSDCSYRHKLKYVQKIDLSRPNPLLDFGTAVHASCEDYLKTRVMKPEIAVNMIRTIWEKNKDLKYIDKKGKECFCFDNVEQYIKEAQDILSDVPAWLEETFPGWEYVDAEYHLYEQIEGKPYAFKGFIDGIIRCKGPRGKTLTWLLDWKTTNWGWTADKKRDPQVTAQLVLYKNFWSKKTGINPKDVRCGFILLKRSAKKGTHCELVTTSVGDVTISRSLKVINNMVTSIKRGIAIKNRESCTFCDYHNTPYCT